MSDSHTLLLMVRTPRETVYQQRVRSIRIPTETGHVGFRPRAEPTLLSVEAGLVNVTSSDEVGSADVFVGTAGGLLICQADSVRLLTPIAVVGSDESAIVRQLDELMQQPNSELEARTMFSKLEGRILNELRREQNEGAAKRLGSAF